MATLALFIALGGVSVAAVKLAANSVGGREIKDNSVTTKDVKDASLLSGDFAPGQLPAGAKGDQGPPGQDGRIGPTGSQGAAGPPGKDGTDGTDGVKGDTGPTGDAGAIGPTGPIGPAGPQGPQGETGGPCDALLCPGTDLPGGERAGVIIDGFLIAQVSALRIDCQTDKGCRIYLANAESANMELDAWYHAAASGDTAAATKDFSIVVFDNTGAPIRRWTVSQGIPIEMTRQAERFQMILHAPAVVRVAP